MSESVVAPAIALTRENILVHARLLPAAPQVLGGLCELLADANVDLDRIAAEIRLEPALAARVLRVSNSAAFSGGQRIGSVDEAVTRVGFGEVLQLVGAATVAGVVDRELSCYGISADRLRETMLLHGLAAEALAARAGLDSRDAYSAGLLRAVGMMVVDHAGRLVLKAAEAFDPARHATYAAWEEERFGVTGMEAAALVFESWQFPPQLANAMRQHLRVDDEAAVDRFSLILHLAGGIVAERKLALPGESSCWNVTPARLEAAGLDEEQYLRASNQAAASFERQRAALY